MSEVESVCQMLGIPYHVLSGEERAASLGEEMARHEQAVVLRLQLAMTPVIERLVREQGFSVPARHAKRRHPHNRRWRRRLEYWKDRPLKVEWRR